MALSHRWALPALALTLVACTASSPQPQPPSATATVSAGASPGSAPPAADTGTAQGATTQGDAKGEAPRSVITNEPPAGGTVTANANPAPSGSDRMQPMIDLVKANKDGFRKCFDLWGKKNPGQAGKIAFQFFLKPDGTLEKAAMKADEGDVHAPEVENCMIAHAKTLTYPKSSVGKETVYTHRFEFAAR